MSAPDFPALLADLAAEEAALDRVVADLEPAAWATPTPAEGWDVRDSIAHLAWTEDLAVLALRDPGAFVVQRDEVLAAGVDDVLLGDGRAMPGVAVRDWWRQSRASVRRELATRDGRDRIVWITGPIAVMSFATARLMETWAHGLDVRAALGLGPEASARLRHVADLGVRTRRFAYETRGRPEPVTPVRVELVAPDGASWAWGETRARDVVRGSALDFCLVVTQRINPDDTALVVDGDAARDWIGIAQAFAGPPSEHRPARSTGRSAP
ncbi:MAG TPA: TIGR03084 family metal-binding protein [Acidimicrobiia bacterium]